MSPAATDPDTPPGFGALLKRLRQAAGLSQEALAERAGLSPQAISALESGVRAAPHRDTVARLAAALRLAPAERARLEAVAAGRRRRGPRPEQGAATTLDAAPRHNLPLALTSFVGRERELAEVGALLRRPDLRLVTLTGPGGVGKTRLALAAAGGLQDAFADGAWLVEFASLVDPGLVAPAVARALGVPERPGRPLLAALVAALAGRRLLLLLDNCEHLVAACAGLAEALLRGCPDLRVLAASREPLGVPGETAWSVPPLATPREGERDPAAVAAAGAAFLFIERAIAARSDFAITDRNAPAVAEICRRLDGLPLALELAAARVRALSAEELAARLGDRFRLLTAGSRTALPRHQTLRAAIDWSHDLLAPPERTLFRRLAVFAGGWTLDAAEAVCAGDGILREDVPDLLARLVDKSLVQAEERPDGTLRYRLLETLRDYARERFLASDEAEGLEQRHAAHYRALAEEAQRHWGTPEDAAWLDRLEPERANLRAMLRQFVERQDAEAALSSCRALTHLCWVRGEYTEGLAYYRAVLATPGVADFPQQRSLLLTLASEHAHVLADYPAARALQEESVAVARADGDLRSIAYALINLGRTLREQGDYPAAVAALEECLAAYRQLGRAGGVATALDCLGTVAHAAGDHAAAQAYYEESLTAGKAVWGDGGSCWTALNLACLAFDRGDPTSAQRRLRGLLANEATPKDLWLAMYVLTAAASLACAEGAHERAFLLTGFVDALEERMRAPLAPTYRSRLERSLAHAEQALGAARAAEARATGRALELAQALAYALEEDGRA